MEPRERGTSFLFSNRTQGWMKSHTSGRVNPGLKVRWNPGLGEGRNPFIFLRWAAAKPGPSGHIGEPKRLTLGNSSFLFFYPALWNGREGREPAGGLPGRTDQSKNLLLSVLDTGGIFSGVHNFCILFPLEGLGSHQPRI